MRNSRLSVDLICGKTESRGPASSPTLAGDILMSALARDRLRGMVFLGVGLLRNELLTIL